MSATVVEAAPEPAPVFARPDSRAPASAKRLDIQGLRAVAVVVVVIDHLTGQPRGGFVGVDVFFVISGYLITALLLRDLASAPTLGHFVTGFYRRRVRRLLPASLTVTALTLVVAARVFTPARFATTRTDAIWSTLFLGNWHFQAIGTDYFAANRPQSPFQHYWSLSVEEQFYVVWPLALFLVTGAAVRVARRRDRSVLAAAAGVLAAAVTIVTLLVAFQQTRHSPTSAYFSTLARAWELSVGGLVAAGAASIRPPARVAAAMSWVGLAVVVGSIFVVTQGTRFPAPEALLPCGGAALVLAAAPAVRSHNWMLTNPPAVLIGNLSYSLYLVHFPVIVLLTAEMPHKGGYFYVVAILLTVGISTMLYYGVEQPVLSSRFLAAKTSVSEGRGSRRPARWSRTLPVCLGAGITFLAVSILTSWPGNSGSSLAHLATIRGDLADSASAARSAQRDEPAPIALLQTQLRTALGASTWPALTPTLSDEIARPAVPPDITKCGLITLAPASQCTFGPTDAPNTLFVIGDSTSAAYAEAYRLLVEHGTGWKVRVAAAFGCEFDTVVIADPDAGVVDGCARHNADVVAEIDRTNPTLTVVTDTYAQLVPATGGPALTAQQWTSDLAAELALVQNHTRVELVAPAPLGVDPASCYTRSSSPVDCAYPVPSDYFRRAEAERALAAAQGWAYVDTEALFCDVASDYCPAFVGVTPIKHDEVHVAYGFDDRYWAELGALIKLGGVS